MSSQWHFEFNDWERAFDLFYRRKERDDTLVFVVSTGPEVSGYWIEPSSGAEPDRYTKVYSCVEDVRKLEKRVRRKIARTQSLSPGKVIT